MKTYVVKIKGVGKVGHVSPAPRDHLVSLDIRVPASCEPLFNEQNLGVVVGTLCEDTVAAGPGRDHVEGHTET